MTVRVVTEEEFLQEYSVAGLSPGGAAAKVGVSRQAIHQAVREGRLDACVVVHPGAPWGTMTVRTLTPKPIRDVVGIYIDDASLERYAESARRRGPRKVS